MNQPTWWRIPPGQAGPTKKELCQQWLDRNLPPGHARPGVNRGVVGRELLTCTNTLLDQMWVPEAVTAALAPAVPLTGVAADLAAARQAGSRDWLSPAQVQAAIAVVISAYAWPMAETVCRIGKQALDRLNPSREERCKLKEAAARLARERIYDDGVLADQGQLAVLLEAGSPNGIRMADSIVNAITPPLENLIDGLRRNDPNPRDAVLTSPEGRAMHERVAEIAYLVDDGVARSWWRKAEDVLSIAVEQVTIDLHRSGTPLAEVDKTRTEPPRLE
ncbi:hypothetical protein ACWD0Z_39220 [Streptomyces sp. NPDC003007]